MKVQERTGGETYCRARSLESTDSSLTASAMIISASRGIFRPVLGQAKAHIRHAPSLAKSAPSTTRGALRLCGAMAASPIIEAFVKGKSSINPGQHFVPSNFRGRDITSWQDGISHVL